jgi:hypothetical protein
VTQDGFNLSTSFGTVSIQDHELLAGFKRDTSSEADDVVLVE